MNCKQTCEDPLVLRFGTWSAMKVRESHCDRKSDATRSSTKQRKMVKQSFARKTPETPDVASWEIISLEMEKNDLGR